MMRNPSTKSSTISRRKPLIQLAADKFSIGTDLYAQLFNGSSDPILILSINLQIEYANTAADKFFLLSGSGLQGKYLKEYLTAESFPRILSAVKHIQREVSQFRLEIIAVDAHRQEIVMDVTIFPIVDKKSIRSFHVVLRDVSQERQIEELVREAQKMEAIQYFVSGTSKELQHPLLAILKRIESIESKYRGRSFEYLSFKEFTHIINFLEVVRKQIKYCYGITEKLTNLNKKRLKFENDYCQANTVIREITRLKKQSFKSLDVHLKLRLSGNLSSIGLGELEFNQIINHIIDNALQAIPAGGCLSIVTSNIVNSHQVRIEISDNGVGIAPENLPHIFEPFFTTKQHGVDRSAGLGLSIVYSLVKAGHGQIHVKSSLRKGTTVQLIFPVAEHVKELQHSRK